jgi:hypothetical protein
VDRVGGGGGLLSHDTEHLSAHVALDAIRDQQRQAAHLRTALDLCSLELLGAAVGLNLLVRAAADSVAAATPGWCAGSPTRTSTPG